MDRQRISIMETAPVCYTPVCISLINFQDRQTDRQKIYSQVSQMEPHFPVRTSELEDLARELIAVSAQLEGRLAPIVLREIESLLRIVNSYYSNLIEGHNTHPVDIERAMQRLFRRSGQARFAA